MSRDVLLKLVRTAMGWENDITLPDNINWPELFKLASEQGVLAIALDGYEQYCQKNNIQQFFPQIDKPQVIEAIGQIQMMEMNYNRHLMALHQLGDLLGNNSIPFLLMKGLSCGRYYPIPCHRPCGDIDIYPGDDFALSNELLQLAGIDVNMHYYRHSVSFINEVMIENHRVLCDLRGPRKQTKAFEVQLEEEAKKSIRSGKKVVLDGIIIPAARIPSANFNALFLPWHVSTHFSFERVTVRHLLDWALFLTNEGKDIDVNMFRDAKAKYTFGYSMFSDILTALSLYYLKMPQSDIPALLIDDAFRLDRDLVERVLNYMFEGQLRERDSNIWKFRWNNVKRVWQEKWKYTELYNVSRWKFLLLKAKGVLFKEGE